MDNHTFLKNLENVDILIFHVRIHKYKILQLNDYE